MSTSTATSPIQLDANDTDRPVVITPEDEDRFSLPCSQAIIACQHHISQVVWFDDLHAMFQHIQRWMQAHADEVHACYAAPRAGQVVVFVIPKSDRFDLNLIEKLVDLDLQISQQFPVIRAEVLQVPGKTGDELQTYVNRRTAKHLYGPQV